MKIQIDSHPILPCPSENPQNILPRRAREERFLVGFRIPFVYGPEGYGDADPVETCACHLGDVLFGSVGGVLNFFVDIN